MKCLKWLDENLEKTLCVCLFMFIAAFMVLNVFMRYILNSGIPWATDLILFAFVWFVWLSISYGIRCGAHVSVTVVVDLLPKKARLIIAVLCDLVVIAVFAWLFIYGLALLGDKSVVGKFGLLVKYPMWSLYLSVPCGLALSELRMIQKLFLDVLSIRKRGEA